MWSTHEAFLASNNSKTILLKWSGNQKKKKKKLTGRGTKKPANRFQIPKAADDIIAATWAFGVRATVDMPQYVKTKSVK